MTDTSSDTGQNAAVATPASPAPQAPAATKPSPKNSMAKAVQLRELADALEAAKGGDQSARALIADKGGIKITLKKDEFTAKGLGLQASSFISIDVALNLWSNAARRAAAQLEH